MLMMKKVSLLLALLAIASVQSSLHAAIVPTGSHVGGEVHSFRVGDGNSNGWNIADIKFDTQDPSKLYFVNDTYFNTRRGVWSTPLFGIDDAVQDSGAMDETRVARVGISGDTDDNPSALAVAANGDLYVGHNGRNDSATYDPIHGVWKVESPVSLASTETKQLGLYGAVADDDIAGLAFVPVGFGGGFVPGVDVIVFDEGIDGPASPAFSSDEAVLVMSATSTDAVPVTTLLYSDTTTGPNIGTNIRGDASNKDGYAYFIRDSMPTDSVGADTRFFINRVDGNGNFHRVFLNDDASNGSLTFDHDDAFTINQTDGSAWFAISGPDGKEFWRVDLMGATSLVGDDYIANATRELSLTGSDSYGVGQNSMAISPDGQYLVTGAPSGFDRIRVYNLNAIPEPSTIALLGLAGVVGLAVRSRRG